MPKILIIDDSQVWKTFLRQYLEKNNDVETATDGLDGINKFFTFLPDVVIVDYVMPKINGIHFTRFIRSYSAFKNVGIILLTGAKETVTKFWAKKSGANLFLSKSLDKETILSKIDEFLKNNNFSCDWSKEMYKIHLQPFGELVDILDETLKQTTLLSEFTNLFNYTYDEITVFKKLHNLFSEIFVFSNLYFAIFTIQRIRLYSFNNNKKTNPNNLLKLIKHKNTSLSKHKISIVNFNGKRTLSNNIFLQPINFFDEEIGYMIFEDMENKKIVSTLNFLLEPISKLFNKMNENYIIQNELSYDELTKALTFPYFRSKLLQSIKVAQKNNLHMEIILVEFTNPKEFIIKNGADKFEKEIIEISKTLNTIFPDMVGRIKYNKFACISFSKETLQINSENVKITTITWNKEPLAELISKLF
ncbi:hypothetical protein SU69_05825 [Thermosipho melanesiensis]|uniref:Response regulator receiver protein n=2 Tax=Thermosipho melanesiensis TaxID=46541 RepID=A6LM49_THEM4|nr:response regulator [Thermosipho melanesiensis]ABR31000.1 response regulator receiver protein [Thermosipho melanesiensis BI429]APT74890.1 hypothetical protein BW47_06125 [Thermosipho melanesiensis]OOC36042.1 hypothetical protein SU68_05895 [Thermosipho melanesiensis]OOC36859.1 hypothetical protein SU69_05825 [Thermosipho melanesiensis]OOC37610.1 hypothetical protein SU70_05835 [Thermosipho melanesiensis]